MKSKLSTSTILASVALPLLAIAPAQAQESSNGIAEIIVTAQKRAENVQDVPIAITAVTAEGLKNQNISSVADLSKLAPNVQLDSSAPIFSSSQILTGFIRGIGQNDVSSSLEPGVGIYLDGVILARSIGANVDLLDVERIEVLKGPQGTLFGRNTIGGAISVVTRDPANRFGVRAEATYGSRDRFDLRGTADIPLGDTLFSQVSFTTKSQKGYQKIIPFPGDTGVTDEYNLNIIPRNTSDRRGGTDTYTFRGKLKWQPSDGLTVRIAADYSKADEEAGAVSLVATDINPLAAAPTYAAVYNSCISAPPALFATGGPLAFLAPICGARGGGVPGGAALPGLAGYNFTHSPPRLTFGDQYITNDIDTTYANGANRSLVKTWGLTGQIDIVLTDHVSLKSITGYREVKADLANDIDGAPMMIATTLSRLREKQFSQELQFNIDAFDDRLKSVFGLYYFREKNQNLENAYLSEGLGQFYGPYQNDNKSYAVYTHNNINLTEQLSLTLGARYTKDKKRFSAGQSDINLSLLKLGLFTPDQLPDPDDPTRLYPLGERRDSYDNFSVRLGAEYKITRDIMLYGSFAQGFKSGGYTTRLSIPTPGNIAPRFDPERADTYEIGAKTQFLDHRLQLNLAAFHTDYKNLQITVVRGISPFIQNAGKAKIDGVELEMVARPIPQIRLNGSVGYIDARYTELDPGVTFSTDDRFVNTPKWTAFVGADIDLFEAANGQVTAHGDYSYKGRMARDAVNTPALIAHPQNIANASLRWTRSDDLLELKVGVLNLTDERYIVTGTQVDAVGATTVTYSRPREYYATVSIKY
ncbi:TonB-dependent receptor [Sphingobium sp. WCS2017Hpa-17]|uniref:TonB-dependent receptor n=1 Tax=Sphingobium sp. WCS2017Hpa-17 TaxID=3073638 RepID=UPI00288B56A7|nr:TonB-dependent receptor [Sphingobium sp. WCS2017Hpa-17]